MPVGKRTERKRAGSSARKLIRADVKRVARENWLRLTAVYLGFTGVMAIAIVGLWFWSSPMVAVSSPG